MRLDSAGNQLHGDIGFFQEMTMNPMTDEEREAHIHDCGRLMLESMAQDNRQAAEEWLQAQTLAIKSRSPEQVARMEAERGLAPCYFHDQAGRDIPTMLRRQAA